MKLFVSVFFAGLFSLSVLGADRAEAAVIGSPVGLIDTDTGLEWLDVTVNAGLSYNQMNAGGLNGYAAQGFRYATILEVGELFENAGAVLPAIGSTRLQSTTAPADLLIGFLGSNTTATNDSYIQAVSGTAFNATAQRAPWIRGAGLGTPRLSYGAFTPPNTFGSSTVGHWLVREVAPVPLPAALPLLAGALGLLAWMRRRA